MNTKEIKFTGGFILLHILMMLTAGIILVYKFEFPDILREPMQNTLALFYKNRSYTVPAYYLFTLSGISFITMALLLFKTLKSQESTTGFLAVVFGVLFGLTSSMGFARWPFLMQYLGQLASSNETKVSLETIQLIYDSFHIYAGVSIGENFAFWFEFLWMFLFSTSMLSKRDVFPRYLARVGQVLGVGMLIYSLEQFGELFSFLGPLNMIVHTGQIAWLFALAFCLFNIQSKREGRLSNIQKYFVIGLFVILLVVSFI